MKPFNLLLVAAVAVSSTFSQQPAPAPTPLLYSEKTLAELAQVQKAALGSDYAYRQTRYLTTNIGPRLTGSAQAQRAVEYVADEMRKAGLEVRLQKLTVPVWVRGIETGEVVEFPGMAPGTTQKIVLTALGGSIATPAEGLTGEIVVVSSFEELNALGREKVAGKIVLFNNKFDRELQASGFGGAAYSQAVQFRFGGAMAAAPLGAIGVLVRSAGGSQNRLAHTGSMGYTDGVTKIPAAAVSFEDAEMLAHLASEGKTKVRFTLTPKTMPDGVSYNVIGDLKGSEKPDEIVVLGGHLDSWDLGTGALDDATGVAVSMQVGYLIKRMKLKPKRTIRVVAFMNEENGGAGGRGYFEEYKNDVGKHFAALESDLGASHPLGFQFAGKAEALPYFAPLSRLLASQGASQGQLQPGGVGADIGPLTQAGVPSFAPYFNQQTYFNYHHTAADTFDKVNPKELAELGSLMAVMAYGLANLEQPLPR
ncbi:MAG TPA: M20/M25/M40 family metallo-hydrolase [Pyrinomonadaceae bacterium]|nr:M20/M25/M40 family metallo-hydrolase [Acidobacteriota bacterium]HQZ98219.1 M20/M25/M40 family metallo-hydrolase [Pyrinomonadaceae bacterium]